MTETILSEYEINKIILKIKQEREKIYLKLNFQELFTDVLKSELCNITDKVALEKIKSSLLI